jgi:ketosteroid isomerase-like protein
MTMQASGVVAAASYLGIILAVSNADGQTPPTFGPCASAANAQSEVVEVIKQMFVAARADDLAALVAITTPDFYAYDGGKRFTAQTLMELIKKAHAAGQNYKWNVTGPEVHIACNFAWVTYVNQGSIEDAAGHQDMAWLESVILQYATGRWRCRFLHSTRIPSAQ